MFDSLSPPHRNCWTFLWEKKFLETNEDSWIFVHITGVNDELRADER